MAERDVCCCSDFQTILLTLVCFSQIKISISLTQMTNHFIYIKGKDLHALFRLPITINFSNAVNPTAP